MVIKCCTAKVSNSKKDSINHVYVQHLGGWASMWCHRGEGLAGARKAHTHLHSTAGDFNRTGNKATACMHWTGMRRRVRFHQQRPYASGARCTDSFFGGPPWGKHQSPSSASWKKGCRSACRAVMRWAGS